MSNVTRLQTSYSNLPVEAPIQAPQPPAGDAAPSVSVRQILGMLRRHKLLIGGLALIGTTIAWLVANQLTPIYLSQADLVIEAPETPAILDPRGAERVQFFSPIDIETESAKIRGELQARVTVRALNLIEHPLFNPDLAPPPQSKLKSLFAPVLQLLRVAKTEPPRMSGEEARRRLAEMTPEERERL